MEEPRGTKARICGATQLPWHTSPRGRSSAWRQALEDSAENSSRKWLLENRSPLPRKSQSQNARIVLFVERLGRLWQVLWRFGCVDVTGTTLVHGLQEETLAISRCFHAFTSLPFFHHQPALLRTMSGPFCSNTRQISSLAIQPVDLDFCGRLTQSYIVLLKGDPRHHRRKTKNTC